MADLNQHLPFPPASGVSSESVAGYSAVLTSSSSANTKGSWAEVIHSLTAATCWFIVMFTPFSSNGYFVDIGIGAAASEVAIISDLFLNNQGTYQGIPMSIGPIRFPAGTRISARCQDNAGGGNAGRLIISVIEVP